MPPKKSIQNQRSSVKKLTSITIPIYEILSNREIREPMIDLISQVQNSLKQDPIALKVSFLNMLVQICGLEEFSTSIKSENTIEILEQIIEKAYQVKNTQTTPLILQAGNKFHKEFIKRLRQFIQAVLSEQMGVFSDQKVQFNQSFLAWLQILTKSKLRTIRSTSIFFTKILIEQQILLYNQYHEKKQSKKAFIISKTIGYYLQKIISQRLNDVDQSIRQISFETISLILEQLQGDVLSEQLLHKVITPLFDERVQVLDLVVKMIQKLLNKCKNIKPLVDYLKQNLQRIVELSRNTQFTGTNVQALRLIQTLHHIEPTLKILNKDYLSSVLQTFAPSNLFYGLHAVIDIFYQSLYKTSQQLQSNSPIVILEIINLLIGISNNRNMNTILSAFFGSNKKIQSTKIFNIDTMFNLLMSQFYRNENNVDVQLKQKQIGLLITIINEWIRYSTQNFINLIKEKLIYQKILESFNNHILINCKNLFFQKMTKHKQISHQYLALFSHIHTPTLTFTQMETYLDFVCQKVLKLFAQEIQNTHVYKQISSILYNLSKDQKLAQKYSAKSLITKLPLLELTQQDGEIQTTDVYRISALLSKFPIQQLTISDNFINNLIKVFSQSGDDLQKLQVLIILHLIHYYNFTQLLRNISQDQQNIYKNARTKILKFYIDVLSNGAQHISARLGAFRSLTHVLKIISSKKFQQTSTKTNAYELSGEEMRSVYEFVTGQLFNSDSLDYSSMDITRMMDRMSLQTHEVKNQIIKFLFQLYEESYVFTCHPQSARFLVLMIKGEHELQKQIYSRSQNLAMSLDLSIDAQRRLNHLLNSYLNEEIKQSNLSKLIYWRLCYQIFTQSRDDQKFQIILEKLLGSYFSKRKLDTDQKRRLTNKLMIFILHAVDKILQRRQYIQLDVYQNIFRKISRKFDKQIMIRIKQFFIQKTQGLQNNYVKSFLETLNSIAKVQIKKGKKSKQDRQSGQSSSDDQQPKENAESDDQNTKGSKDQKPINKRGRGKSTKRKSEIMEVEENDENEDEAQQRRSTRSNTKKKLK